MKTKLPEHEVAYDSVVVGPFSGTDGVMRTVRIENGQTITLEDIDTLDQMMRAVAKAVREQRKANDVTDAKADAAHEAARRALAEIDAVAAHNKKLEHRIEVLNRKLERKEEQLAGAKREIKKRDEAAKKDCKALRDAALSWASKWEQLAPEWPGWVELKAVLK